MPILLPHTSEKNLALSSYQNLLVVAGCFLPTTPTAFPSPGWTRSGPSVPPHRANAPAPSSYLWPSVELAPLYQCLSCIEEAKGQTWTQYSRYSVMSAELRGTVTSLALLAVPLFMQPRRLLPFLATRAHCCLTFTLLSVCQEPQSLFCRAAPQPVSSQPVSLQGAFPSQVHNSASAFAKIYVSPVSPFLQPA